VEKNRKAKKLQKNGHAQKYQQTVRGIHVVNPKEEKEGYSGKDLQKREVLTELSSPTASKANQLHDAGERVEKLGQLLVGQSSSVQFADFQCEHSVETVVQFSPVNRHNIEKYLDTIHVNQTARKALPPTIAKNHNRKMADCPSCY